MRIASASVDGHLIIEGEKDELRPLYDEGMLWKEGRSWASRVWMLPEILKLAGRPEMSSETISNIKIAHAHLRRHPAPSEIEYEFCALREYQRAGVGLLRALTGALLADDVGLGKTIQSGTVVGRRLEDGGSAIVACTLSTRHQWAKELVQVIGACTGSQVIIPRQGRARATEDILRWAATPRSVLIVNHDSLRLLLGPLRIAAASACERATSLTFVFDEIGYIKNHTSKTFAAAVQLAALCTHRIGLTATPFENVALDLWAIFQWVSPGYLGPVSTFERRYVKSLMLPSRYGPPFKKIIGYRFLDELRLALRPMYLRRTAIEVGLQLPDIKTTIVELDMTPRQAAIYDRVAEMWDDGTIEPRAAMVLLQKICNDPSKKGRGLEDSPKLDEIDARVEEAGEERIIVFTRFRTFAVRIMNRLARFNPVLIAGGIPDDKREHAKAAFTAGTTRVLIMTAAGERGLNLQAGGKLINADLPWNPAAYRQRLGRIYRIGSIHDEIEVVNLVMKNSIEARVIKTLASKQVTSDSVIETKGVDAVRDTLSLTVKRLRKMAKRTPA